MGLAFESKTLSFHRHATPYMQAPLSLWQTLVFACPERDVYGDGIAVAPDLSAWDEIVTDICKDIDSFDNTSKIASQLGTFCRWTPQVIAHFLSHLMSGTQH